MSGPGVVQGCEPALRPGHLAFPVMAAQADGAGPGAAGGEDRILAELAAELAAEDSVISPHVREPSEPAPLGLLAAAGQATDPGAAYGAIVESVREGYLLHYGEPRLIGGADHDLALLAGDYMYAKGLERLAALGDLRAVRELSDLISLSAQLHADDPPADERRPAALWLASVVAIAVGPSEEHEAAKQSLRAGGTHEPLRVVATEAAEAAGLSELFAAAAETVGFRLSHRG